tara:strand:- start:69 stop:350 length:282 start_codon:yes stop_codon:yes gene_type:complete
LIHYGGLNFLEYISKGMGRPDDFHYEYDSDKYNEESFKVKKALSSLGLKESSSKEDIKKAYHNLAKKFHPDVSGNQEDFKKIKDAYDYLMSRG